MAQDKRVYFLASQASEMAEYIYTLETKGAAYFVEEAEMNNGWFVTVTGY